MVDPGLSRMRPRGCCPSRLRLWGAVALGFVGARSFGFGLAAPMFSREQRLGLRSKNTVNLGTFESTRSLLVVLLLTALPAVVGRAMGQTPAAGVGAPVSRPASEDEWRRARPLLSLPAHPGLVITNALSQQEVFAMSDPVSVEFGMDRHVDSVCGFGALVGRAYVGSDSVVRVAFLWDRVPKVTRFTFAGTNAVVAEAWRTAMTAALERKLGPGSVRVQVVPGRTATATPLPRPLPSSTPRPPVIRRNP